MSELTVVAQPYAKAAFDYARDAECLDDWQQMFAITQVVLEQPNTLLVLNDLDEDGSEQPLLDLILHAGGEWLNQNFENFLRIMEENKRLKALSEVNVQFQEMKADYERTMTVTVRVSEPLDEEQMARLKQALNEKYGKAITLETQLDPSLVGGVVITAGQTVYDGSVLTNLSRLATNLHV
ncbi:ATP synthase subunit delta 2 [Vibrio owensii]|uniref:ATP synthase subunit delta n=1 Tax=Vibrio owensii TaxID=696485 RepID=A0AAU9QED7_9VIBR|nr:ATP synthase subunit delta 2 [Vibrio owensii]